MESRRREYRDDSIVVSNCAPRGCQLPVPHDVAPDRLYLIDASAYVHRAFHALPPLSTRRGLPTNAVLGFARMLVKLLREERARRVVCVFDAPGKTFRSDLYHGYKAHRPPLPDEMREQLPYIRRLVEAMRIPIVEVPGVEADDVIGTLAAQADARGVRTVVVTADKDLMQIVGERVELFDEMRGRRVGPAEVVERFGVPPAAVPDVLGLTGDTTDAVPGIGPKPAAALVAALGPIDDILANLDAVERLPIRGAKRVRERLEEGADAARLSRDLATIRRDVPVSLDVRAARWEGPDVGRLRALLEELEFSQLARELAPVDAETAGVEHAVIDGREALAGLVRRLLAAPAIAMAGVLDGPRPTVADVEALAFWTGSGPVAVLPRPDEEALVALASVLGAERVTKVGGGLKSLRVALARRGIALAGPRFDVELASYCLNPSRAAHDAISVARDLVGLPGAAADGDALGHVALAARAAWSLRPELEELMERQAVAALYRDLEMPLADVLARMELDGVRLDVDALAEQSCRLAAELEALLAEIHALAGTEFNVNSPPQLRSILFERLGLSTKGVKKTKTGLSTDVDVLTKLAAEHPLPAKILDYRARAKLKSTYVDALPGLVDAVTGRLHTTFNQTVAATGRLSSSEPNLQNIPIRTDEGRRIRRAFVADDGCRLVSADYSQIELRVLAHLSRDERLVAAFASGEDVHARTAAEVFGDRPAAEGRRLAKVINYGILYGMGPVRAARELGMSSKEAGGFIQEYFDRHPGVRCFFDETLEGGRQRGYVTTLLGRRRYLPELGSDQPSVRQFAERAAVNTPVQGSAADLIKLAMLEVDRRLAGSDARMLLQVHDELVVEAPADAAPEVAVTIAECMRGVWSLEVPLEVDVAVGHTWADIH
jgi:DNA polymerase-1